MTRVVDFNAPRDTRHAHFGLESAGILHIFDAYWHGVRAASGYLPGHKLAISHQDAYDGAGARYAIGLIYKYRITRVIFQGFSWRAEELARALAIEFGDRVWLYAVTHVSTSQFEHIFEMEMIGALTRLRDEGVLRKLGSVKPDFGQIWSQFESQPLINAPPRIDLSVERSLRDRRAAFVPVENTWRKNLYVNMAAACTASSVDRVYTVNEPTGLDQLLKLDKVSRTAFLPPRKLLDFMGSVGVVVNVTLVECQPMTKLEAAAMGTPCITGALQVPQVSDHPYSSATEVSLTDQPGAVRDAVANGLARWEEDRDAWKEEARDFCELCRRLCLESYSEFLEL